MKSHKIDPAAALSRIGLFTKVDQSVMREIASKVQIVDAAPGHVIIHHGDTDDDVYFLLSGTVIGQMSAESGREIVFTEMQEGICFGELAAIDGQPRSITVSARGQAVLARLSGPKFVTILNENPVIAMNLAGSLAQRLRHMNERVFGLVVHDVETRVRLHVLRLAQEQGKLADGGILKPAPTHEEMATYVGANREAVSRAIAKLNKSGMIKASRQSILIQDCDRLLGTVGA